MTIREKLVEMFGPDAPERVVGSEWAFDMEVEKVSLATDKAGEVFLYCGTGEALVQFTLTSHKISTLVAYLVRSDSDARRWDSQAALGIPPEMRCAVSRPRPRLMLVASC